MQEQMYDDAELLALKLVRTAALSDGPGVLPQEFIDAMEHLPDDRQAVVVCALVCALARHSATAFEQVARSQGLPVSDLIDRFEMHKLEQQQFERDERGFLGDGSES